MKNQRKKMKSQNQKKNFENKSKETKILHDSSDASNFDDINEHLNSKSNLIDEDRPENLDDRNINENNDSSTKENSDEKPLNTEENEDNKEVSIVLSPQDNLNKEENNKNEDKDSTLNNFNNIKNINGNNCFLNQKRNGKSIQEDIDNEEVKEENENKNKIKSFLDLNIIIEDSKNFEIIEKREIPIAYFNEVFNINTNNGFNIILFTYNKQVFEYRKDKYRQFGKYEFCQNEKIINNCGQIISIFNGVDDFKAYLDKGKGMISQKINAILFNINKINEKYKWEGNKRPLQMANKYKVLILERIYNNINNFDELKEKNKKIKKIDKTKVLEQFDSAFNLNLLSKPIYAIISNDLSGGQENKKNNYDIIKDIIDDYNENGEETPLIQLLRLTMEDCLNRILYENEYQDEIEKIFEGRLKEYIQKIYNELKYDNETKKDYIAGFLLLLYNLKKYYCEIQKRKIN